MLSPQNKAPSLPRSECHDRHCRHCRGLLSASLTSRGADLNQALTSAAPKGHIELVAWLLKNGVDNVNFKAFNGKTALDLATDKGHDALANLLRANGGVSGSETKKA